jgi:hypothetical protein
MERSADRRSHSTPQCGDRHPRRVSERIGSPSRSRFNPHRDQQTNPAAVNKADQRGDLGEPLSAARIAGRVLRSKTWTGSERGRKSESIFDAIGLRPLPLQLDSSPLAVASSFRDSRRGRGGMAEESFIDSRVESENPQHHERSVRPRNQVEMDRSESYPVCSSECEAHQGSCTTEGRADRGGISP